MRIPYTDLAEQLEPLVGELTKAFARVVRSGRFVLGPEAEAFEHEFRRYVGTNHVVSVANGTAALVVALQTTGIRRGDEVITIPSTFIATAEAIAWLGATPVLVDVDSNGLMDPTQLAAAITERTRAIVPVHLHGRPSNLPALRSILRGRPIRLVADGAQAHGATIDDRSVAAWADVTTYSFYPSKNLGATGEGGAVATNDAEIAARARQLRNHHSDGHWPGFNWRLGELEAASLRVLLPHLNEWNAARRRLADRYTTSLRDVIETPEEHPGHVYHHYVVRHPHRDALRRCLAENGVETRIHYDLPVHVQPPFNRIARFGALPEAERRCREILSLPLGPWLGDDGAFEVICRVRCAVLKLGDLA